MDLDRTTAFPVATPPLALNAFTFTAPGPAKFNLNSGSRSTQSNRSTSDSISKTSAGPPTVALRSAFNSIAPANHLAYELVVQILSSGSWSRWYELLALTHVCQHWRNVALATPQLWAEAARSAFASGRQRGRKLSWPRCLPVLIKRSEPFPLSIHLPIYWHLNLVLKFKTDVDLQPHISRLTHLSVKVNSAREIKMVLQMVHAHMRQLKSLCMPQSNHNCGFDTFGLSWDDADLPRLHTLAIGGFYFNSDIAVASLKNVILCNGPGSHNHFLNALERCGSSLESLTLDNWLHPARRIDALGQTTRTVQLPRLRRLKVAFAITSSNVAAPTLLFAALSLPPDVAIDLDWEFHTYNAAELLPKHIGGLHAPPFFDAMCLHILGQWHPEVAVLHGYIGSTERLRVREQLLDIFDRVRPVGLGFCGFPYDHQWPTVARLAVDLDTAYEPGPEENYTLPTVHKHTPGAFVAQFPNLGRLDLLGRTVNDAKLQMADAFLSLPSSAAADTGPEAGGKTLAYVCSASKDIKNARGVGLVDAFRAQLDKLELLLASHRVAGGPGARLHRLEIAICVAPAHSSSRGSRPPPLVYPSICDVSLSAMWTGYLSSIYVPRFKELVDEVVFVGDVRTRVPGYRIVMPARAMRQPPQGPNHRKRGEKPRTTVAVGRNGR